MVGLVRNVKIPLLVQVAHHILIIVAAFRSVFVHAIQKLHECWSQVFSNKRPLECPSKYVPHRDAESLVSTRIGTRNWGYIKLDGTFAVHVAPSIDVLRCTRPLLVGM